MGHPVEDNGAAGRDNRRKIAFIAVAFLLVAVLLFGLISYAKFQKKFHGDVVMPEAKLLQAQMSLDINAEGIVSGQLESYLSNLQPGDYAKAFAAAEDADHKMVVTVLNHAVASKTNVDTYSDVPMKFRLCVDSMGHLPMEFIMVDEDGKQYVSKRTGTEYRFYELVEKDGVETPSGEEAEFKMDYSASELMQQFSIFVGWDNDADKTEVLTDLKYRKELEILKVKVEIDSDSPGIGYTYTEEELQELIPVPPEENDNGGGGA